MIKYLLRLIVALIALFIFPTQAFALNWRISAKDPYLGTGTSTYNYVMAGPTVTFRHVNSIYLKDDPSLTGYELGWAWNYERPKPYWFVVVIEDNKIKTATTPGYNNGSNGTQVLVDPAQPNNPNALWVYAESGQIVFRIDNVQNTWYWPNATKQQGLSVWGSERQNTNESNFAHFWALGKKWDIGGWNSWGAHWAYNVNDHSHGYHLWRRGVTEGWSSKTSPASNAIHQY